MTEPASFSPACAGSSTETASGCPAWWPSPAHPQAFRRVDPPDASVPLPHTPTTLRTSPCSLFASIRSRSPPSQGHAHHNPHSDPDLGAQDTQAQTLSSVRLRRFLSRHLPQAHPKLQDFSVDPCGSLFLAPYVTEKNVFRLGARLAFRLPVLP